MFLARPGVVMDTISVSRAVIRLTHLRRIWSDIVVYSISCCNIFLDFASFTALNAKVKAITALD